MEKTDARKRYTQMVLKQSLLKLLKEKPVNKITVKEVCELSQLNRATFYAHYSDCFALLESIENELIGAFERSLRYVNSFDVTALIEAIYDMIDQNREACSALIIGNTSSTVLKRMIALAKKDSIAYWQKELPMARDAELEMMYTHLSNGLMHVVVEDYERYSKEEIIRFVSRVVKNSLSLLKKPAEAFAYRKEGSEGGIAIMKENRKLLREVLNDIRRDMTDEEVLDLLADSKVSVRPEGGKEKYTLGQRAADSIAKFAGSWAFIFSFSGVLILWMVVNVLLAAGAFDPYPFILLNLVLSCVAAIQAPLIMMSQNRQEEKDRRRAENDYKVNLKTEIMIEDLYDKVNAILAKQSALERQIREDRKEEAEADI